MATQTNKAINQLELVKSLITQAQGYLEDKKPHDAAESLNTAFITFNEIRMGVDKLAITSQGNNTSTEQM